MFTVFAFAVFAASAFATQVDELAVTVPFAFKAGASTLPAGTYRISSATSGYILIRGEKGGVFVPRSAVTVETSESGKATFLFNRAGDKFVLQTVHPEK